jgi:hypothetical protein
MFVLLRIHGHCSLVQLGRCTEKANGNLPAVAIGTVGKRAGKKIYNEKRNFYLDITFSKFSVAKHRFKRAVRRKQLIATIFYLFLILIFFVCFWFFSFYFSTLSKHRRPRYFRLNYFACLAPQMSDLSRTCWPKNEHWFLPAPSCGNIQLK